MKEEEAYRWLVERLDSYVVWRKDSAAKALEGLFSVDPIGEGLTGEVGEKYRELSDIWRDLEAALEREDQILDALIEMLGQRGFQFDKEAGWTSKEQEGTKPRKGSGTKRRRRKTQASG